jgi:hypothetical protein
MAGLVPAIHALPCSQGVDARDKRGHDGGDGGASKRKLHYSALMFAALMIGHHLPVSALWNAASASGVS